MRKRERKAHSTLRSTHNEDNTDKLIFIRIIAFQAIMLRTCYTLLLVHGMQTATAGKRKCVPFVYTPSEALYRRQLSRVWVQGNMRKLQWEKDERKKKLSENMKRLALVLLLLLHDWNEMQWKIETQVHVISFRTITIQFLLYSIELSLSSWIAQNGLHSISFIEYALYTKIHTYYTFMCTITPNWIINIHCSTLPVIRELPNVRFIYI